MCPRSTGRRGGEAPHTVMWEEGTRGGGLPSGDCFVLRGTPTPNAMPEPALKTLLFLGSARKAPPFFGRLPSRTGDRVVAFAKASIDRLNAAAADKPPI